MKKNYSYRLIISYKGTRFSGWQRQEDAYQTVQSEIEETIKKVLKTNDIHFYGASRTDAGVHAYAQQAVLMLDEHVCANSFMEKLSFNLHKDIKVLSVEEVVAFNPSVGVVSKVYHYYFSLKPNTAHSDPYVLYIKEKLDLELMKKACLEIIGEHSFEMFSTNKAALKNTHRSIIDCSIELIDSPFFGASAQTYVFKIEGSGFLKYMVRNLFAAIQAVGQKSLDINYLHKVIMGEESLELKKAPAKGLHLVNINYSA